MTPFVDPAMAPILAEMRAAPPIDYPALPLAEARAIFERTADIWNHPPVPGVATEDTTFPTPAGPRRARLYRPPNAQPEAALVYAHGGGWTFGSIESHHRAVALLALESRVAIVSIDYRLAPEHPAPAGAADVTAAIAAVEQGVAGLRAPAARIAVAGNSAGANVALGGLIARRDAGAAPVAAALLFYGCFAPVFDTWSHAAYGDGAWGLTTSRMRWFWNNHLGGAPATDPIAAPLHADLAGLPPLFLVAAGLDPLADDTVLMARRCVECGVAATVDLAPGVVHGFLRFAPRLPAALAATRRAADHLRRHLAD